MSFSQSFRLALKSLATSKMRALLTMLGIIIGVAAVIIIISLGGVIGIVLGVSLATVAGNIVGITAKASLSAITISAGVSLAVGVLFGYLPANKAARLNPIDALRYD